MSDDDVLALRCLCMELVGASKSIEAVKFLRDETGKGLVDAIRVISKWAQEDGVALPDITLFKP